MTTSTTDELVEAISDLRLLFPDWRMGQMFANLIQAAGQTGEDFIWDIEDGQLLSAARRLIERNQSRKA